jgi:hypothetical protein
MNVGKSAAAAVLVLLVCLGVYLLLKGSWVGWTRSQNYSSFLNVECRLVRGDELQGPLLPGLNGAHRHIYALGWIENKGARTACLDLSIRVKGLGSEQLGATLVPGHCAEPFLLRISMLGKDELDYKAIQPEVVIGRVETK